MNINSYKHACQVLNIPASESKLPFTGKNLTPRQKAANAHYQLTAIIEAMHTDEPGARIYYPYFYKTASGWAYDDYDGWNAATNVGPRLQFAKSSMCKWAAEQHQELYNDLFN